MKLRTPIRNLDVAGFVNYWQSMSKCEAVQCFRLSSRRAQCLDVPNAVQPYLMRKKKPICKSYMKTKINDFDRLGRYTVRDSPLVLDHQKIIHQISSTMKILARISILRNFETSRQLSSSAGSFGSPFPVPVKTTCAHSQIKLKIHGVRSRYCMHAIPWRAFLEKSC